MKVLVYVDDSRHWEGAVTLVGEYVRRRGGSVTLLSTTWSVSRREDALQRAGELLELPPEQVRRVSRVGLVENVVPDQVSREGDYDLVVIGRLGGLDWLTNGLVADLLVKRTPASVLVVRGKLEEVEDVLVCTEGPRHGPSDVEAGARVAETLDGRLTILHVLSQLPLTGERSAALVEARANFMDLSTPEAAHLRRAVAAARERRVDARAKVRVGLVVEEILSELHERPYDLLILGAHAPEGKSGILLQDIAGAVLRASPVSTLVVRGDLEPRPPAAPATEAGEAPAGS